MFVYDRVWVFMLGHSHAGLCMTCVCLCMFAYACVCSCIFAHECVCLYMVVYARVRLCLVAYVGVYAWLLVYGCGCFCTFACGRV